MREYCFCESMGKLIMTTMMPNREDQMVPVLPPDLLWTHQGIYEDEAAWANPSCKKKPPSNGAASQAGGGGGVAAGGRSGANGNKEVVRKSVTTPL